MGGFHYWPDPPAGPGPTVLCKCGHGLPAHTGTSVAGVPCKVCGVNRKGWPTGRCMGWEPAGATPPTEAPAGPPDLTHAIQTAGHVIHANALHPVADERARCDCWAVARIAVGAAAPVLLQATRDRHADLEQTIQQLDRIRMELFDELRAVREGNDRLQGFEQAITDAFGELRWDKISTALVALHTPALDQAAPREDP